MGGQVTRRNTLNHGYWKIGEEKKLKMEKLQSVQIGNNLYLVEVEEEKEE